MMRKHQGFLLTILFSLVLICACNVSPQPIKIGLDGCTYCKMIISDNRFGGEIVTQKGKMYKFDDIHCLQSYKKSPALKNEIIKMIYFVNFVGSHELIESSKAHLYKSDEFHSPMSGNIVAFEDVPSLNKIALQFKGNGVNWAELEK